MDLIPSDVHFLNRLLTRRVARRHVKFYCQHSLVKNTSAMSAVHQQCRECPEYRQCQQYRQWCR